MGVQDVLSYFCRQNGIPPHIKEIPKNNRRRQQCSNPPLTHFPFFPSPPSNLLPPISSLSSPLFPPRQLGSTKDSASCLSFFSTSVCKCSIQARSHITPATYSRNMARSGFTIVAAVAGMLSAAEALKVVTPSEGMTVVANR